MNRYVTTPTPDVSSPHLYRRPRSTSTVHKTSFLTRIQHCVTTLYRRYTTRRYWFSICNLLRLFWLLLVLWGERWVWDSAISACAWDKWERWPAGATPHRVALVADPQIVDIHTYPRRGFALAATIFYSDKYLSRAWSSLHDELAPAEAHFLGDLFDGGREWVSEETPGVPRDPHEEKDWKWYGNEYWMKELRRFQDIFPIPSGVRVKTGLPGNHDFGFGKGVKTSARGRFEAFFGPSNERWEAGNHTWVILDGVSLSNENDPAVYGPPREFLESLSHPMQKKKLSHEGVTFEGPSNLDQPTILLTHVPLFREKDTDCGPLREKGHSIPIFQGYQYQNVLSPKLSAEILKHTKAKYVFTGDDHDACKVEHMYGPQGKVHEWTVKSISWTMGVRKPAFEMLSLWNPQAETGSDTVQAHLCLLPDQIGIFKIYAVCGVLTLLLVTVHVWLRSEDRSAVTALPTYKGAPEMQENEKYWKPNKQTKNSRWFFQIVLEEMLAIAAVAITFYLVLLWRW
ncbi:hypothetical protein BZA77DRAFT_252787 [Pyronema omphalodes]|nr:hypothetical protein BZA77DRAFT_252787 [Pyronema omphalodes]